LVDSLIQSPATSSDTRLARLNSADETVVNIDGEQFWFIAAVVPDTNRILHPARYSQRNQAMMSSFLRELDAKHDICSAEFLVDDAPWLQAALFELGVLFCWKRSAIEIPSNVFSRD